jgi:hypothetical protein
MDAIQGTVGLAVITELFGGFPQILLDFVQIFNHIVEVENRRLAIHKAGLMAPVFHIIRFGDQLLNLFV